MWSIFKRNRRPKPAEPAEKSMDSCTSVRRWLEREEVSASLLTAIEGLGRLMADRKLGGPGFLTVQLPQRAGAPVTVSCQYPNISEILYQAALCGTAADLLEAGVPAQLLNRGLRWEAESGAVVVLLLDAAPVDEEVMVLLAQLHSRNEIVRALAEYLSRRCPDFTVRPLAGYILLTPAADSA